MTMVLTDQTLEVVAHFTQHMPPGARATYEAKVREMLMQFGTSNNTIKTDNISLDPRRENDEAMQATQACVEVMWMLWEQARRECKCGVSFT